MANQISSIKKPIIKKFKKSKSSRKLINKELLNKEYNKLKSVLPTINKKKNVDQLTILNESLKTIVNLEKQVLAKFSQSNKMQCINNHVLNKSILHELFLNSIKIDQNK